MARSFVIISHELKDNLRMVSSEKRIKPIECLENERKNNDQSTFDTIANEYAKR